MHFVCVKQNNKEECIAGIAYAKCLRRSAIKNGTLLIFLTLQDTVPVMSQKVGHVIDFILYPTTAGSINKSICMYVCNGTVITLQRALQLPTINPFSFKLAS